ncbi:DUF2889 domain-containing protein [Peterkaempfera bronchialis]|uniref:DUF2889 domain-containing protein n=1 Tax=Peterkaempfera bronchialis TaxID=2126346 RepID=A0A345SRE0_9ACTN|nr:DUF2889 domain-containing protein [Peterkaempfera bronchialis]AXI76295.1 DUF2889 domain-containing protein [Peterkaempfera bronchialis]
MQKASSTVRDVARRLPARRPSSVRRTTDIQVVPESAWDGDLEVRGSARDARVDGRGTLTASETTRLHLTLDNRSVVTGLAAGLPGAVADALVGSAAAGGFRARLRALPEGSLDPDSPAAALLDDLPTVRLISGYGRLIEMGPQPGRPAAPLPGICTGWAPGGTADRRAQAGERLLGRAPAAPPFRSLLDHPDDFHPADSHAADSHAADLHPETPPERSSMRRRRILEVARHGGDLDIYQYFRDSHLDAAGREGSLHEYELHAVATQGSLTLSALSVRPRALPFPECPLAAAEVGVLLGTSLYDIEDSVRARLSGTRGCTHLSDVLRFLRFAGPLADRLM